MSMLQNALTHQQFAVTAELAPPKGWDFSHQIQVAKTLQRQVHGINVTDMQSACLKASSLGLCIALKQAGLEPILQITGRDRNRMGIVSDLLSAAAFGIDTVLCLTGDHPKVGDHPGAKPVYDLDSVGILQAVRQMEEGRDCGGSPLSGTPPTFFKGAVVTPVYEPLALQILKLRQKVDAGAQFIQTQCVFQTDQLTRLLDAMDKARITVPVMAGVLPLKSAGMARYMNEKVPGVTVPADQLQRLEEAAQEGRRTGVKGLAQRLGIQMAAELIAQIRDAGLCAGVHVMAVGAEEQVPKILALAGL